MSANHTRIEGTGAVRKLILARAESRNAFNAEFIAELTAALRSLAREPDLRVLVIAAEGETFCAGADFRWMSAQKDAGVEANLEDAKRLYDLFETLYNLPCATIARVQGGAFGGGAGLLTCCDIVIMAEDAVTAFSEVRIGLVPATISPFVLRRLGEGRARELFLTGSQIPAQRALELGLANRVAPVAALDAAVEEYTASLLRCSPDAVRVTKQLLRDVPGMTLTEAREWTARLIAGQRVSRDGQEGMAAFLEKRKPDWVKA